MKTKKTETELLTIAIRNLLSALKRDMAKEGLDFTTKGVGVSLAFPKKCSKALLAEIHNV